MSITVKSMAETSEKKHSHDHGFIRRACLIPVYQSIFMAFAPWAVTAKFEPLGYLKDRTRQP